MRDQQHEYLSGLERMASHEELTQFYLWPRTPSTGTLQEEIISRVGVSDFDLHHAHSRPGQIVNFLRTLSAAGVIGYDFSILDLLCGDGIVLWQVKKSFPDSSCFGVDCKKNGYETHEMIQRGGVKLYKAFLQHLVSTDCEKPFDVAIMLNTYRGWKYANLREHEEKLPDSVNDWFMRNARFVVLTATRIQLDHLRELGFFVNQLGKGEDDSEMVCISKSPVESVCSTT